MKPTQPLTWQELLKRFRVIDVKAHQVRQLIIRRAQATCDASGIDHNSMGTAGHNAMIDFRAGKPWREVHYPTLRRALWIMQKSHEPNRIASAAWSRLYAEWKAGGCNYDPIEGQES